MRKLYFQTKLQLAVLEDLDLAETEIKNLMMVQWGHFTNFTTVLL